MYCSAPKGGCSWQAALGPKAADCLRNTSDASRSKPGTQVAAILDVADGTVRSKAARKERYAICLLLILCAAEH
jgi:hypothetical protein